MCQRQALEDASNWDNSLDWAVENINLCGGVVGRRIELVKHDIAKWDIDVIADQLIADDGIKAVIGPLSSSQVFEVAPKFITGKQTAATPVVFTKLSTDNIFILTSGDGTPERMLLEGSNHNSLTPAFWKSVFENMRQKQNFRQLFWAVESCYSGKIGEAISTPGVMLMTGANPYETSKAYLCDSV